MMNWRLFRFAALLFTLILAACLATGVSAAPAAPTELTLTQPDGTSFPAHQWGDEWLNGFETDEGYTILRESDGWWAYATLDAGGALAPALQSSGQAGRRLVGSDSPEGLPLHLRPAGGATAAQTTGAARSPNAGSQPTLVLLASFSNRTGTYTPASFNTLFFGPSNSVQDYFLDASFNQLTLVPAAENDSILVGGTANDGIVGWLNLGYDHPNTGDANTYNQLITRNALLAADPYVNFTSFDTNGDNYISLSELHIVVIVAGYEAAYDDNVPSVWGHRWDLDLVDPPVLDGKTVGNSNYGGYTQFGEIQGNHQATIGIMVHELGHDLTWPDLYDIDYSSEGVGDWSIMGGGSWNSTYYGQAGSSPAMPDAWLKWYQGWITPTVVNGTLSGAAIEQAETNPRAYLLRPNPGGVDWNFERYSGSGEFFLVENRQLSGYDSGLPGCGLLVWHIDESVTPYNDANANENHPLVKLIEADGLNQLYNGNNRGDAGDPFPGSYNKVTFNYSSVPNSRLYSGADSLASVSGIGSCAATMTANLTYGSPVVNDRFVFLPLVIKPMPNVLPVANSQSVSTSTNTATSITLTASDADGNPLTWILVSNPLHGSLSGTAPYLTYTPAWNYTGSDSFTFKVYDGYGDSNVATVSITIGTPGNTIQNGGFESGRVIWTQYSSLSYYLIYNTSMSVPVSPHSGSWLVWTGGYEEETDALSQSIFIPQGRSFLHYWFHSRSNESCYDIYDVYGIFIEDALVYAEQLCSSTATNNWVHRVVDLSAYAGTTQTLEFLIGVDVSNYSYVFLDDISLEPTSSLSTVNENIQPDQTVNDEALLERLIKIRENVNLVNGNSVANRQKDR